MHPCLSCGACCAYFRVAFHWLETQPQADWPGVPVELTAPLDGHRLVMQGTRASPVRCVALDADIGRHARCTIYAQRPSVCREVVASWENGAPSGQCDRARLAHGLPMLLPSDWTRHGPIAQPAAANDVPHPGHGPDDGAPAPDPSPVAA